MAMFLLHQRDTPCLLLTLLCFSLLIQTSCSLHSSCWRVCPSRSLRINAIFYDRPEHRKHISMTEHHQFLQLSLFHFFNLGLTDSDWLIASSLLSLSQLMECYRKLFSINHIIVINSIFDLKSRNCWCSDLMILIFLCFFCWIVPPPLQKKKVKMLKRG